jgi:hypothetical protein
MMRPMPFESLDYLYWPSDDVAADAAHLRDVAGARVVFAIEASGTRVAMLELAPAPPSLLLADHLTGEAPILVYRVTDLEREADDLAARGWSPEMNLEIPQGPCRVYHAPGGQRIALYQLIRPDVLGHFAGRLDF